MWDIYQTRFIERDETKFWNANTLSVEDFSAKSDENFHWTKQAVIFKALSYSFEETIGFDVKDSFANGPVMQLIKPGYMTK